VGKPVGQTATDFVTLTVTFSVFLTLFLHNCPMAAAERPTGGKIFSLGET
jgi:hypothetical protein